MNLQLPTHVKFARTMDRLAPLTLLPSVAVAMFVWSRFGDWSQSAALSPLDCLIVILGNLLPTIAVASALYLRRRVPVGFLERHCDTQWLRAVVTRPGAGPMEWIDLVSALEMRRRAMKAVARQEALSRR
ncbi:hypothetical protein ABIC83_002766 [Roseateles asaccharophilus]|uniref:hypothetical protein n=1 Tax=Roseateles asaccharophilus TaxID=582607 RepID=UPI00383286C4